MPHSLFSPLVEETAPSHEPLIVIPQLEMLSSRSSLARSYSSLYHPILRMLTGRIENRKRSSLLPCYRIVAQFNGLMTFIQRRRRRVEYESNEVVVVVEDVRLMQLLEVLVFSRFLSCFHLSHLFFSLLCPSLAHLCPVSQV